MKIRFIKSPIAEFNMAYAGGTEAELPDAVCEMLINAGYAEKIGDSLPIENMAIKKVIETPEKTKRGKK